MNTIYRPSAGYYLCDGNLFYKLTILTDGYGSQFEYKLEEESITI